MTEPQERTQGPDDTAAFQRFYSGKQPDEAGQKRLIYRLLVGWWRDRN